MKKILVLFLAVSLFATLGGCAGSVAVTPQPQESATQTTGETTTDSTETKTDEAPPAGDIATGGAQAAAGTPADTATTAPAQTAGDADIGEEAAKEIALADAGLSADDVTFMMVGLDRDVGRRIYEVEFFAGMTEYSYEIDAKTGEIWEYDVESMYD